ncbi:MAG: winged helix-turn-helix domain-containing protein [Spirochaetia bacterium]|nr:winged helix-turn-helix domain-containing protein [Spirochaetia bacterium]
MMLEGIFGNKTAEKILLHIFHYGEIHAAAIATDYNISESQVRKQLERFEKANILVSKTIGKARVYFFNKKTPFLKPILDLLRIVYESISIEEKENIFKARRRPRRKEKLVI